MEQSDHIKKGKYQEDDVITVYESGEEGEIVDVDSVNEKENCVQKVIFRYFFPQARKPILATQNSAALCFFHAQRK